MKLRRLTLAAISLAALLLASHFSYAQETAEAAKIQYLIESVQQLQGVKFIRNGGEYDAAQAAEHLRFKLKKAGPRVRTAEDFIRLCASKSYISGEAYRLRFPDGKVIPAEDYFRERLQRYK